MSMAFTEGTVHACVYCLCYLYVSFICVLECYEDNGESYRGNLSKTRSGIPCGLWSDHTFRYVSMKSSLERF